MAFLTRGDRILVGHVYYEAEEDGWYDVDPVVPCNGIDGMHWNLMRYTTEPITGDTLNVKYGGWWEVLLTVKWPR